MPIDPINTRIKQVRIESGLTQEAFSAAIGQKRGNYSQVELGNQGPTLEMITSIARKFSKSYEWLLEGLDYPVEKTTKGNGKGNPKGNPKAEMTLTEPSIRYGKSQEVVLDTSGHRLVPIVDIRAAAGEGYYNPETLEETDVFRLPQRLIKGKNPLCIRIKGPSMAPTLQDGAYVIITLLEKSDWLNMRNEWVYVVVDTEGKTFIKRIKNRLSGEKGGFVVLTSDNPDKQSHPNFNLHPNEISFIWFVEMYFSHKMPNIHDQYYTRLQSLEDQFQEMRDQFQQFAKRLK